MSVSEIGSILYALDNHSEVRIVRYKNRLEESGVGAYSGANSINKSPSKSLSIKADRQNGGATCSSPRRRLR